MQESSFSLISQSCGWHFAYFWERNSASSSVIDYWAYCAASAEKRKEEINIQFEELEKALTTLQNAIKKIDLESKTKFKDTLDNLNIKVSELFPKLFGGGFAKLELTSEDLLEAGVIFRAMPPGKKNVNVSQLSGGEKALSAISLVFSFFSLNPAPFCILDEVDAPLDDNNVDRYCSMVEEISKMVKKCCVVF